MPEPVDSHESYLDGKRREWQRLMRTSQQGAELTPEQNRALEIRKACLAAADVLKQLLEDPAIKEDAVKEASATARYWELMLKLQDFGIEPGMHVGKPQDFFTDPLHTAEYMAGQYVEIERDKIQNVRQALFQLQEHSIADAPKSSQRIGSFLMGTENTSPSLDNWFGHRSVVNMTHALLASDLDSPAKPE